MVKAIRIIWWIVFIIFLMQIALAETGFMLDSKDISDNTKGLLQNTGNRIAMLLPALFIIVSIIAFMLDFGTVGVIIGSMLGLGLCVLIGLILIDAYVLVAFIIMGIILIFKMGQ
jgi:hypothetical protein